MARAIDRRRKGFDSERLYKQVFESRYKYKEQLYADLFKVTTKEIMTIKRIKSDGKKKRL